MSNEIVNDLFAGFVFYCGFIALVFIVIEAVFDDDPDTLGCPDPELHDRNNEARNGEIVAAALDRPAVDPIWYPVSVHSAAILEHVNADNRVHCEKY